MNIDSQKLAKLEKYAELENSEIGECWIALLSLVRRLDCCLSDGLAAAVEKEIEEQIANIEENAEIVEREETRTVKFIELEWHEND